MASNQVQSDMVAGLRAVVSAADELIYSPDVDSLFRQAVEFAREKLNVERCGISLPVGDHLQGTYGTNMHGGTTDERNIHFMPDQQWFESIDALQTQGGHYTTIEGMRQDWDGEQLREVNEGWVALTPIRSARNLIGVFFNDTAISGAPLDPNTQEVISVFCSLLGNMIERKRAESALAEERNLLRTVIDIVPDYIFVKDADARIVLSNTALAELTGADSPEVLVGKSNFDLFPEELAASYNADDMQVMYSGKFMRNEEEITHDRNGNPIWLTTTKIPLRNQQGTVTGLVGIAHDVSELKRAQIALEKSNDELEIRIQERIGELERTNLALQAEMAERRQAEEHLRQSEERFAKAFHSSPIAITLVTLTDSIYLDVNARYLELMGYDRDELIGKSVVRGHPPMSGTDQDRLLDALNAKKTLRDFEITLITKSGELHPCQVSIETIELDETPCLLTMIHDVTEQKRIEQALVEERTLLRTLIDTLPDYIFIKDTAGNFIMSNKAHALAANVINPDDFRGKSAAQFFPLDLAAQFDEDDRAVLQTGQSLVNLERVTLDAERRPINVSTTKVPLRDAQGKIVGVVGISRDITAFKQAQAALKQQEEFLRQVIDANPSGLFVKDWDGRFVLVNKAHADMNGLSFEDMIGKNDLELGVTPEAAETYTRDDREVMTSRKPKLISEETFVSVATGKTHWLRTMKVPLFSPDGEARQVLGVALDITERKQAEAALQASEERYRTVTELISDYAFSFGVNPDRTIRYEWGTVDSFKRIAGYTPEEIGTSFRLYHPDDVAAVSEKLEMVKNGHSSDHECRIITKSGELRWVHLRRRPVWNDDHTRVIRYYGVSQDITGRKLAEEALQRANAELRTANDEVRRFAYIVSHDLRAPLVNIKGFSSELRGSLDIVEAAVTPCADCLSETQRVGLMQALNSDIPEALGFISASVERMNNLINAILKLSRLGQRELQIEPVNTAELVQDIIMSLGHQIVERQATIVIGDLPTVSADYTAMEQIFGNILNNAVLYLAPERPGQIEITAEEQPRETVFHVRDNGQGIAESDRERVFELFRRAGKPTVPGEGMGLAYVKALVRRHEGRIWFDSELGSGSTFSFTIPHRLTQEA